MSKFSLEQKQSTKKLEWLVKDYLKHMKHHVNNQILAKDNA